MQFSNESGDLVSIKSPSNEYLTVTPDEKLIWAIESSVGGQKDQLVIMEMLINFIFYTAQFVCTFEEASKLKSFQSLLKPHLSIGYCRNSNELVKNN